MVKTIIVIIIIHHGIACLHLLSLFMHAVSNGTPTCTIAPGEAAREKGKNTQATGLSVTVGILSVVGVLLVVMLIVVAITRKPRKNPEVILKGS